MNSVIQLLNATSRYLSEALYQQSYYDQQENETNSFSYGWTVATSIITAVTFAYVIKRLVNTLYQPVLDTPERFWRELDANKRNPPPLGPVVVMGQVLSQDLYSLQKEMFSSCNRMSEMFVEYVQRKGLKPSSVIDLGCGIGANSIPLLRHGIKVIAMDNMQCLLDTYDSRINNEEKQLVSLQCSNLIDLEKYSPEDNSIDVALAIDVLPYLPSSSWKSTMQKIVLSLKPGGYLFGTVFVKEKLFNPLVVKVHENLGAQYYPIQDLAIRLIKHSGLEMVECRQRKDSVGCYEFVARKPIPINAEIFFDNHDESNPLIIENNIDWQMLLKMLISNTNDSY